jgi:dienelactone hydrolase
VTHRAAFGGYLIACCIAVSAAGHAADLQFAGTTLDESVPAGVNFDKAEFRLWYPSAAGPFRGVVVLMPGSNGDGRSQVDDPVWQAFAVSQQLALVGARLTDKPHDQGFIEHYVNVSQGSGQAFLDALAALARRSAHPELATAPLLLWGMSAGGQFNYEFVNWKPERVAAFVVNKGGIYFTALTSRAARNVPGLLCVGGKDLDSRTQTIAGLFALNRRAGALWALAEEPGAAHVVGRSRDLALLYFEEIIPLRFPAAGARGDEASALRPLAEGAGLLGDPRTRSVRQPNDPGLPGYPMAWLPTSRVARAWEALVNERPFER